MKLKAGTFPHPLATLITHNHVARAEMSVQDLIRKGESATVEFKEGFDREAVETVGAMATTKGGVVLIGVTDKGIVKGVQVGRNTLKDWTNQIAQSTEMRVVPDVDIEEVDGRQVVVINVREAPIKPVSVKGKCFRRVGNSNRVMTPQEIAEMHLLSTNSSWDMYPARDTTVKDLALANVRRYMADANATGRRNFGPREEPLTALEKIELLKGGKPTWAALLLFGKEPQNKMVQATVHIGRFKQETMVIDDALIKGSIIDQVNDAMAFVRKNLSVKFVMTGKPKRDEVWDYPLDAVREAIINAICHRDYTDNADIQIKIHDDRMTIWNPGGLPGGMTMEDFFDPGHGSRPRNKFITQVFFDIKYVERYGRGIKMILDFCREAGLPAPDFQERFGGFMVTFRKDVYNEEQLAKMGLNERQTKAVLHVKSVGKVTNSEYLALNNCSSRTARYDLEELVSNAIFIRVGSGRATHYKLASVDSKPAI